MDEQPPAAEFLIERVVDHHLRAPRRCSRHPMSAADADDAARPGADADELHHRVGPHQLVIHRILIGKQPLRQALADDDDLFTVGQISLALKSRPAMIGTPSEAKIAATPRAELGARIVLAVGLGIALSGELCREERARFAPRHQRADRHLLDARELADAADRFLVEQGKVCLRARPLEIDRHVDREHVARVHCPDSTAAAPAAW